MSPTPVLALSTAVATFVVVALLLLVAAAMIAVAVWLIRRTRRDAPALGPLEVMADRSWRRGTTDERDEILAAARPEGAPVPAPMLEVLDDEEAEVEAEIGEPSVEDAADLPDEHADQPEDDDDIEVEVLHRYHQPDG